MTKTAKLETLSDRAASAIARGNKAESYRAAGEMFEILNSGRVPRSRTWREIANNHLNAANP